LLGTIRSKLTYANVVATLALFIALGGGAYAAFQVPAGSVGTKQLKNKSVTPPKLARSTIALLKGNPGPTGKQGAPGVNGSNATIAGVAAGGDLAGTYPAPTIASGAITTSKFGTIPAAAATNSTAQSIPNATSTNLTFDTNAFDSDGLHSTTTHTDRLTAPVAGTYVVSAWSKWGPNSTGTRTMEIDGFPGGETVAFDVRPAASLPRAVLCHAVTPGRPRAGSSSRAR
jgi:hypothetical protein